jgi:aquaporin Z
MNALMLEALKKHWPEYLIEACGLGTFMISACAFGALLEHPASPVRQTIQDSFERRILMGLAMGLTAISLVYSPWGKRSGAHLNPAVTLTFFRLGKVTKHDTMFYVTAQFVGAVFGVWIASVVLPSLLAHPAVNYVVTMPGKQGAAVAFVAEAVITFALMLIVLIVSNQAKLARYTGLFAGVLVTMYITFEAPLSGMSMNPARTFGAALGGNIWTALWIYFTAPPLGMLLAAESYLRFAGAHKIFCAKLHHHNDQRCIFRCNFDRIHEDIGTVPQAITTGALTGKQGEHL